MRSARLPGGLALAQPARAQVVKYLAVDPGSTLRTALELLVGEEPGQTIARGLVIGRTDRSAQVAEGMQHRLQLIGESAINR